MSLSKDIVTTGGISTVTVTVSCVVYAGLIALSVQFPDPDGLIDKDPLVPTLPIPLMLTLSISPDVVQVNVVELPKMIEEGLALILAEGLS